MVAFDWSKYLLYNIYSTELLSTISWWLVNDLHFDLKTFNSDWWWWVWTSPLACLVRKNGVPIQKTLTIQSKPTYSSMTTVEAAEPLTPAITQTWPRWHRNRIWQAMVIQQRSGKSPWPSSNVPSGKLTLRPWQLSGLEDCFPLKMADFQGQHVNLLKMTIYSEFSH